jgi:cation diffusion facilitator family transporter
MAGGSRKVVLIALFANGGIAAAKFVAALATKSNSMMAEAIHSAADCGNQGLLLLGGSRAEKPADERHPLGYGREAHFWALMVAVVLFTVGGLFAIYEGVAKLSDPRPLEQPIWAVGVLVFAIALETYSLTAAWNAVKVARGDLPLMAWARRTGDVDLLVVMFEDIAAEAGLVLALAAVSLTWATGDSRWDGAGSIAVGAVLLVVAVYVGAQMRRLIVGSAADPATMDAVRGVWDRAGFDVVRAVGVWSGPGKVLVAMKVRPREGGLSAEKLIARINETEKAVRAAVPEVGHQFVEPDVAD